MQDLGSFYKLKNYSSRIKGSN